MALNMDTLLQTARIFEDYPDAIALVDRETRYLLCNTAYLDVAHKSKDEVIGRLVIDLVGPVVHERFARPLLDKALGGEVAAVCSWFELRGKGKRYMDIRYSPFRDESGSVAGVTMVLKDMTEQYQAEEKMKLYQQMVTATPDMVTLMDRDLRYLMVNEAHLRTFRLSLDQMIGRFAYDVIPAETWEKGGTRAGIQKALSGEVASYEARMPTPDGDWRYFIATNAPFHDVKGEIGGVVTSVRDITPVKKVQEELAEAQQRQADIINFLPDATFVIDNQGVVLAWNRAMEKLTGIAAADMVGKGDHEYAIPLYGRKQDLLIDLVQNEQLLAPPEFSHMLREDDVLVAESWVPGVRGEKRFLWGAARILYDSRGNKTGAIQSIRDRTDRKQADDLLHYQKALLEAQNETSLDGILVVSPTGRLLSWNQRFVTLWDIPPEVVESRSDEQALQHIINRFTNPADFLERVRYLYRHPEEKSRDTLTLMDGKVFDRYTEPVSGGDGVIYGRVWFFRDITEQRKAETELREKEQELQRIRILSDAALDLSRCGYWYIDFREPGIMVLSDRVLEMSGEVPGSSPRKNLLEDVLPRIADIDPENALRIQENFRQAVEGRLPRYRAVYAIDRPVDGKRMWMKADGQIERDAQGRPVMLYGVAQDITDEKNLELEMKRSGELLNFIVNTSPVAIAIISQGILLFCNKTFNDIFGIQSGESPDPAFVDQRIKDDLFTEILLSGHASNHQVSMWDKNHQQRLMLSSFYAMDFEGEKSVLAWMVDISEMRRLNLELVKSRDLAEAATRAKSDFLANMSHEIRTPMNAIIGMAHLALRTGLDPRQRDYLQKIDRAAGNLLQIINDILDFSKIEAGKLVMEHIEFRLDETLANLSTVISMKAHEKGLEFIFDIPPGLPRVLVGDPLRLNQVLVNICSNAVKFTESGEIIVSIRQKESDGRKVRLEFSVRDSGIGMTEDQRQRLFQAFTQADSSTTRKYGGTGLGLSISARIVQMMEGMFEVESQPDQGSTFRFTVRFDLATDQLARPVQDMDSLGNLKVLIVDDNQSARQILSELMQSLGFRTETVISGQAGIALLEKAALAEDPFDLVLMDWKMPGMDGIEASRRIKTDPLLAPTPTIIMTTAYGNEELMEQAEGIGLNGFLVKPISASAMLDAIMHTLAPEVERRPYRSFDPHAAEQVSRLRGARILLVEDNDMNQQVAMELLESAGFVVSLAKDGQEALDSMSKSFHAVLMDIQMPRMDGYEACRRIRQNPEWKDVPIIAMTANALETDRARAFEAGMVDHVAKPINTRQLYNTLSHNIIIKPENPLDVLPEAGPSAEDEGSYENELPPALPGIDLRDGLGHTGKVRFYLGLLQRFPESQGNKAVELRSALESGDMTTSIRIAHSLKSVAGNIGALELFRLARDTETELTALAAGSAIPWPLVRALEAELDMICNGIVSWIAQVRPGSGSRGTERMPEEQWNQSVETLKKMIARDDGRAPEFCDHLIQKAGTRQTGVLEKARKHLENYDFDQALAILENKGETGSVSG